MAEQACLTFVYLVLVWFSWCFFYVFVCSLGVDNRHAFPTISLLTNTCVLVDIERLCMSVKYQVDEEPNSMQKSYRISPWGSHVDPIGDRNDIRESVCLFSMLVLCLSCFLFFTVYMLPKSILLPLPPPGPHGGGGGGP